MKITFNNDQIELSQGYEKVYQINDLNAEKIVELLGLCISFEDELSFEEGPNISPVSKKICDLIKNGLNNTKDVSF